LYQKWIRLQEDGDPNEATEAYLEAMEIHARYSSFGQKTCAISGGGVDSLWGTKNSRVNQQLGNKILDFVVCDRCPQSWQWLVGLRVVNRRWDVFIRFSSIWKNLYASEAHLQLDNTCSLEDVQGMWYLKYRWRKEVESHFPILFLDFGSEECTYQVFRSRDRDQGSEDDPSKSIPAKISKGKGHYWANGEGVSQFKIGDQVETSDENPYWKNYFQRNLWSDDRKIITSDVIVFIGWIARNGLSYTSDSLRHPQVISLPAFVTENQKTELLTKLFNGDSEIGGSSKAEDSDTWATLTRANYAQVVSRELLALKSYDKDNGISVIIDGNLSTIVVISKGIVAGKQLLETNVNLLKVRKQITELLDSISAEKSEILSFASVCWRINSDLEQVTVVKTALIEVGVKAVETSEGLDLLSHGARQWCYGTDSSIPVKERFFNHESYTVASKSVPI